MSCYPINIIGRQSRRGFTLVELLVVIVIIGILASLIITAATSAMRTARQTMIKNEIAQIDGALLRYKQTYEEFPPDFSDEAAVMRHVRKRWPQWQNVPQSFPDFCNAIKGKYSNYDFTVETGEHGEKSRGAHIGALAFWLGGIPDNNGMLNGFSADVSDPLGLTSDITQWDKNSQFMELTLGKNCDIVEGVPVIIANKQPFVYFKPNAAGKYVYRGTDDPLCFHSPFTKNWADIGVAVPYAKTDAVDPKNVVWHNPKSYQLIHPGLDGQFSVLPELDNGDPNPDFKEFRVIDPAKDVMKGTTLRDRDNQANFGGTTIETAGN